MLVKLPDPAKAMVDPRRIRAVEWFKAGYGQREGTTRVSIDIGPGHDSNINVDVPNAMIGEFLAKLEILANYGVETR